MATQCSALFSLEIAHRTGQLYGCALGPPRELFSGVWADCWAPVQFLSSPLHGIKLFFPKHKAVRSTQAFLGLEWALYLSIFVASFGQCQHGFIHLFFPSAGCPPPWKKHGRKCYFFSPERESKDWNASRAECTAMDSDLLVIDSKKELVRSDSWGSCSGDWSCLAKGSAVTLVIYLFFMTLKWLHKCLHWFCNICHKRAS
uniref:C-type lectin domain-containing protein n=1 Tax=Zonotrichia albicollis TaxID=44394 RepID=A0A8D2LYR9_ZONAL